jgi:hypothetical protein
LATPATLWGPVPTRRRPDVTISPTSTEGNTTMGKGNNSQKNDKKDKKPKQDKTKAAPKK